MSQTKAQLIDNLVQPITGAAGSASAPTFSFTADPNTGLYSPGADQLAISTNGTGRLFINSSGNVGIGVSTPQGTLSVEGEGRVVTIGDSGIANRPVIKSRNSTDTGYGYLHYDAFEHRFFDSGIIAYVNGQNTHIFYTGGTERVRLDSSGRLGLGTSSPSNTLHVVDSSSQYFGTVRLGGGSGSSGYYATIQQDALITGKLAINSVAASGSVHGIQLQVDGTSALAIDASRRVGIGTTTPANTLDVNGNLGITTGNVIKTNDSGGNLTIQGGGTFPGGYIKFYGGNGSDRIEFGTTGASSSLTERMRIGANGNVFIGGTSGGARLNVEATWSQAPVNINVISSNPSAAQIDFKFNSSAVGNIVSTSTSTAYNTSSDYRLKENVTAVTDGITRLQQLKPSRFNFIADPAKTVDGFIAHEVQDVVPEAITGEKDAVDADGNPQYQGIDQSKLVPLLTAALQEAVAKIESLEARLTAAGI